MLTSFAITKAVSCNLTSKYAMVAPSRADSMLDSERSVGTMGGSPGLWIQVRVFLNRFDTKEITQHLNQTCPQNSQTTWDQTRSRLFINYDVGKWCIALFRDLARDQIKRETSVIGNTVESRLWMINKVEAFYHKKRSIHTIRFQLLQYTLSLWIIRHLYITNQSAAPLNC